MEVIKKIILENFPSFDVSDVSDQFYGKNVIKLHSYLEKHPKKIFIIERNEKNEIFLQAMCSTDNKYVILNRDNYLSLHENIFNDKKNLHRKITNFFLEKNNNLCCVCQELHVHCTLCNICNAITCYNCMTKLYISSKKKDVLCPLCRNDNLN